jgi:uncharacterized protein YfaS (alpha-2-macroglobulin family)
MRTFILAVLGIAGPLALLAAEALGRFDTQPVQSREKLEELVRQGNYKDAFEGYRALALDPKDDPRRVGGDLRQGISCLNQLGRIDEVDAFRDAVIESHKTNWRLLKAAADSFLSDSYQFGFILAGTFHRGQSRSDGRYVSSSERDRARAIQLLVQGLEGARSDPDRPASAAYMQALGAALLTFRTGSQSWRLQTLTPLETLPDYGEPYGVWGQNQSAAPVAVDGTPIYYEAPRDFASATNDGQRWRWALDQAVELNAAELNASRSSLAGFLVDQFGTQTLGASIGPGPSESGQPGQSSIFALETLKDEETIARLATGVRRFTLPDALNPIKIYQKIADDPRTGHGEEALGQLASIFENRRQFERATEYFKKSKAAYGDPNGWKSQRLAQIEGAWGQFESNMTQPAGRGATLDFRFRNGHRVQFEAHEIQVAKLLSDVKNSIGSRRPQLDWQQIDISDIGSRIVAQNQEQYLGRLVARWDLDLEPPSDHHDRQITVSTPLQKAGAYLVTARMEGGNTSLIVVWLDDTVIARKGMSENSFYFVADSRTGKPVAHAELQLFGYRMVPVMGKNEFRVETKTLSVRTDAEGQAIVSAGNPTDPHGYFQWLCIVRTGDGRFAHLGFAPVWRQGYYDPVYTQVKSYAITDRPVYRPGQPVHFKFWVAHARYDQPETVDYAHRRFTVEIHNPKGEKALSKTLQADAWGGFDGTFELPSDAALGVYSVSAGNHGGGTFRVEEYKKPEFEVKVDAPETPVMLGEKVKATIKAKYYFGAPVAEGKVKYTIRRTPADVRWYPPARWDWLFGPGYWWFAPDSAWYPGWSRWGVREPVPSWWWGRSYSQPEVVAEAEDPIRPDGTIPVEIDTALAKAMHPDEDHRYQISAEVTDQSRRTIVGSGTILVARKPFAVYTWVDRGHYRTGETIEAGVRAQMLDQKPVAGRGTLSLLRITYDADGKPIETPVDHWDLVLDAQGQASQPIRAGSPGQYRLSANIDDGHGHAIEGGYLITITGQGFDGASFRYGDLELVPDRKEYRPGDTVRLMINTNHENATVLLFVRPVSGVYPAPRIVHLRGKSTTQEIGIVARDMPNMFVEAVTVSDGKVHTQARQIAVPPESRIVDVHVEPSAATYKPGQKAEIKVKLTGPDGKPFVGSTVLSVYDKAVEFISGGSNVPDIKEFFWKWKREHYPRGESSLDRWFYNLVKPNDEVMRPLGIFGGLEMAGARFGDGRHAFKKAGPVGAGAGGAPLALRREASDARAAPAMAPRSAMMARAASAPAPMAVAAGEVAAADRLGESENLPSVAPIVRTNFADTAYWAATLSSSADGTVEVEFPLPESLTTWKVRAWSMGAGTRVGQGQAEVITTKDLLVRLQAPRFFVQKDEVVLSADVHNKLKTKKAVQVVLETEGSVLELLDSPARTVQIDSGSEQRVDWRVKVAHEGQAIVRMKALTDEESDAAQMSFPAYVHGMLKMEAFAGAIRPDQDSAQISLRVPQERRPEQSRLEIRYSPTLAGALVDALPYLADYPYGCTEQTLNRFLPTVITQNVLMRMGVDLKAIRDKRTNLNAQELGDAKERAQRWKSYEHNPVYDPAEVAKIAAAGVARLADMQLSDGGWGWFSGYGEVPSPHTTALVVHGLQLARQNELSLPQGMIERGTAWLASYQDRQVQLLHNAQSEVKPSKTSADDVDALVFMVLADAGVRNESMLTYLDRDRPKLSVYAKALLGLALEKLGEKEPLARVMQNLHQYIVRDDENQTVHMKLPNEGIWWWWFGSETETHAFTLKLMARTDPKGELAAGLAKYLINNRRHGHYWGSTRDTTFCIEALADYLKASGEDRPDLTVSIALDGKMRKEVRITPEDLFHFDNALVIEGTEIDSGAHTVSFRKEGKGPLYWNAYLSNFTLEDPITRTGLEIKIDRKVYRLVRDDKTQAAAGDRGQATSERVEHYRREPLVDGATLKSGELVEIELAIDSKNDYEYLVFEDYKAAGFEPLEVRSGYNGNDLGAYVEFRDDRVVFFSRTLARGLHSVSYRLRAEVPGAFHALPARAQAMYAPELKANSDEIRLKVAD